MNDSNTSDDSTSTAKNEQDFKALSATPVNNSKKVNNKKAAK